MTRGGTSTAIAVESLPCLLSKLCVGASEPILFDVGVYCATDAVGTAARGGTGVVNRDIESDVSRASVGVVCMAADDSGRTEEEVKDLRAAALCAVSVDTFSALLARALGVFKFEVVVGASEAAACDSASLGRA